MNYLIILLLLPIVSFGQSGPAGIGSSTNNVLWLRAEAVEIPSGDNLAEWVDYSGHSNDLSQPVSSITPIVHNLKQNGFPVVQFNKTNGRLRKTNFNDFPSSALTIIYVNKNNGETNDGIISYAVGGSNNEFLLYNSNNVNPHINGPSIGGTVDVNDNVWHIVNTNWQNSNGDVEVWKDGVQEYATTGIQVGSTLTGSGSFALAGEQDAVDGSYDAAQAHFGLFTEVIFYNTYLNTAQLIILNNYLSAKYDLTLSSKDIYNEDNAVNGNYDFEVAGIGRTNASNIHNDAQGTGIVRILNPSNLGNNEFMIWGHNNGLQSFVNRTNTPASVNYRLDRVWRVSETDTIGTAVNVGSIDMRFDMNNVCNFDSTDEIVLLIDTDNDGLFSDETPITGSVDIGGNVFEFSSVSTLANNTRFTLGINCSYISPQIGPGGVGTYLENVLWVRAEDIHLSDGANITVWKDNSCNWNNLSQPINSFTPILQINELNGFSAVQFNKANGRLRKVNFNNAPTTDITTIYVNKNNSESNDGILSYATTFSHNDYLLFSSNNIRPHLRGPSVTSGISANDNNWHIINAAWTNSNGDFDMWKDGSKDFTESSWQVGASITPNGCLSVAGEQDGIDDSYSSAQAHFGYFTEVIAYNIKLNDAQNIIVSNYLAAKYGLTLSDNDIYNEDNTANGNYDYEVAGIGRVNALNIHNDAQGTAIVRINNPSNLGNDEFLLWGHDNGVQQATNFVDIPVTIQARFDRVWRASEVNSAGVSIDVGTIDISFDLSNNGDITTSDLRLLIDEDNDGVFIDETPIAGAISLGCGVYQFPSVSNLADNRRFTIGTIDRFDTPLPIELLYFKATLIDNQTVELTWETAAEINNDYFTIEKSKNGLDWTKLDQIKGAGNSSQAIEYGIMDRTPFIGVSYYRLKQTDFDGGITYSKIQLIDISIVQSQLLIYPNPAKDNIIIKALKKEELSTIKIYTIRGRNVTGLCKEIVGADLTKSIDISNLPKGVYIIKTKTQTNKIVKY